MVINRVVRLFLFNPNNKIHNMNITSQQIRESNNSFPSKIQETYELAANRIDELELVILRLRKALEDESDNSSAYEAENSRLWSMLQKLLKNLPGSSTAYMEIEREMKGL
jgi:hypothetical protein